MPDLERAVDEMRGYVDRPPASARPIGEVAATATRNRHRRWARAGGLAVSALLFAAGLGLWLPGEDESEGGIEVIDEPSTTTSTTLARILVEPSRDLVDGQEVRVTGSAIGTHQGLAICDANALNSADPLPSCDLNVVQRSDDGAVIVTVTRRIQTSHGIVDCAERAGRCVVGIRTSDGSPLAATLSFRGDLEELPTPELALDMSQVANGDSVQVTVTGLFDAPTDAFADGLVYVSQCTGPALGQWESDTSWDHCDIARQAQAPMDADGTLTVDLMVSSEILTYDGWQPCDPCFLVASAWRQPLAVTRIDVTPNGPPLRPSLRMEPTGPYAPGQLVRIEGAGFGPGGEPPIGWCAFRTDEPASEIQGDTTYGHTACSYPGVGLGIAVDGDGTFSIDGFPLPNSVVQGFDCFDSAYRCGLAVHEGEGTPPSAVLLFELDR